MEHKKLKPLPIGIQTYSEVINRGCLYIDKTKYIAVSYTHLRAHET